MRTRRWLRYLVVLALCAAAIAYLAIPGLPGVDLVVINVGRSNMHRVTVHVTGRSYEVEDLLPGAVVNRRVRPTSESHVEIDFTDDQGQHHRLAGGGYFEPGYRGMIVIEVSDGKVVRSFGQPQPSLY